MCEAGGFDDVVTYEPFYVEEHIDSSEFETTSPALELRKKKNKKRIQAHDAVLRHANVYYQKVEKVDVSDKNEKEKEDKKSWERHKSDLREGLEQLQTIMDGYGDVKGTPSKWSLIKHKVVSISNMFGRKCITKVEKVKEEETDIKSDKVCDVFCARCIQRKSRKVRRKKQHMYITEGSLQVPVRIGATKIIQVPVHYSKDVKGHPSDSFTSLSDNNTHTKDIGTEMKEIKVIKTMKDKFNQTKKRLCKLHQHQPVFENHLCALCNQKINRNTTLDKQIDCNNLSVEYLDNVFHDVQSKYQIERTQDDFCVHDCSHYKNRDANDVLPKCCRYSPPPVQGTIQTITPPGPVPIPLPTQMPTLPLPPPEKKKESKVDCQCYSDKGKKPEQQTGQTQAPPLPSYDKPVLKLYQPPRVVKPDLADYFMPPTQEVQAPPVCPGSGECQQPPCQPPSCCQPSAYQQPAYQQPVYQPPACTQPPCQYPHEAVKEAVQNKYKGEIVCIHNPPCVLINGCLNLPGSQPEPLQVYTTTNPNKSSLFRRWNSKSKTNEQGIQHRLSLIGEQQCQTSVYRADKIMQSSCNHEPRCEVVRRCTKNKIELPVQDSCVHIPKCPKLYEAPDDSDNDKPKQCDCQHKHGECEMKRTRAVHLTAKEHTWTQVKPKYDNSENFCVHVPVCKKLPQCCFPERIGSPLRRPVSDQRLIGSEMPISTMDYVDYSAKEDISAQANTCHNPRCESYEQSSMFDKQTKYHSGKGNLQELRTIIEKPSWTLPRISMNKMITLHSKIKSPSMVKSSHESTCINIPRCTKEPKYLVEKLEESNSVQRTRSLENTMKHYIQLTPRDEAGIQVATNGKLLCRHHPHCIRIPKCLGNLVKDSVMPYEDIPDCDHRPFCELIPACCRKINKEVNSVGCQYPASCRVA